MEQLLLVTRILTKQLTTFRECQLSLVIINNCNATFIQRVSSFLIVINVN